MFFKTEEKNGRFIVTTYKVKMFNKEHGLIKVTRHEKYCPLWCLSFFIFSLLSFFSIVLLNDCTNPSNWLKLFAFMSGCTALFSLSYGFSKSL
jgi:hypothetical protein